MGAVASVAVAVVGAASGLSSAAGKASQNIARGVKNGGTEVAAAITGAGMEIGQSLSDAVHNFGIKCARIAAQSVKSLVALGDRTAVRFSHDLHEINKEWQSTVKDEMHKTRHIILLGFLSIAAAVILAGIIQVVPASFYLAICSLLYIEVVVTIALDFWIPLSLADRIFLCSHLFFSILMAVGGWSWILNIDKNFAAQSAQIAATGAPRARELRFSNWQWLALDHVVKRIEGNIPQEPLELAAYLREIDYSRAFKLRFRIRRETVLPLSVKVLERGRLNPQDFSVPNDVTITLEQALAPTFTDRAVCLTFVKHDYYFIDTGDFEVPFDPSKPSSFWIQLSDTTVDTSKADAQVEDHQEARTSSSLVLCGVEIAM